MNPYDTNVTPMRPSGPTAEWYPPPVAGPPPAANSAPPYPYALTAGPSRTAANGGWKLALIITAVIAGFLLLVIVRRDATPTCGVGVTPENSYKVCVTPGSGAVTVTPVG